MKTKMSEEKYSTDLPAAVIMEVANDGGSAKRRSIKKYVIIASVVVLALAVILTAILVGMYLFTEAQNNIIKLSYNRDANTKEDVTSDLNKNIVQYHTVNPDYEMWVVDDFNRDIQVAKVQASSGIHCFVTPLNRTLAVDPSKVQLPSNLASKNSKIDVNYRAAETTIPDSSFLSKTARDTCSGISTYWVLPNCEGVTGRQKRGSCCAQVCYWGVCVGYCWC